MTRVENVSAAASRSGKELQRERERRAALGEHARTAAPLTVRYARDRAMSPRTREIEADAQRRIIFIASAVGRAADARARARGHQAHVPTSLSIISDERNGKRSPQIAGGGAPVAAKFVCFVRVMTIG